MPQKPRTEIDLPGLRDTLWHRMRGDLANYIPEVSSNALLMCPACGRFLPQEDFGLEHIIPQQALRCDPESVRDAVPTLKRSGATLLCRKRLIIKGTKIHDNGCNSWKGKYFDGPLKDILTDRALREKNYTLRQSVSLLIIGYLAAFSHFGYRIAFDKGGLLLREQFFRPYNFAPRMPLRSQMVLMGSGPQEFREQDREYWERPFRFVYEREALLFIVRVKSIYLPISRNPDISLVTQLRFAPPKHILRPNFTTVFD